MYSSIEVRALYPVQLMVTLGWRPRSCAYWSDSKQSPSVPPPKVPPNRTVVSCSEKGTHRFALIEANGVAVWHRHKAAPPLAILLQILKKVSRENGASFQRILKHHRGSTKLDHKYPHSLQYKTEWVCSFLKFQYLFDYLQTPSVRSCWAKQRKETGVGCQKKKKDN